jgi:hypothetical protein
MQMPKKLDMRKVQAALDANCLTFTCKEQAPCKAKILKRIQEGIAVQTGCERHQGILQTEMAGKKTAKSETA